MPSERTEANLSLSYVEVSKLKPNPWNTNVVSPENELKIEASMKRLKMFKPILARELPAGGMEILGGEHRWRVAKKLGHREVPVINLGIISDQQAKEIGLVDNGRYGEDDTLQLAELLKGMGDINEIGSFLPMTDADFSAIFSSVTIPLDSLDIPEDEKLPELPTSKPVQTHQVMRFKVPVEDAQKISEKIERVMKEQGFIKEDALANAGNALVYLFSQE